MPRYSPSTLPIAGSGGAFSGKVDADVAVRLCGLVSPTCTGNTCDQFVFVLASPLSIGSVYAADASSGVRVPGAANLGSTINATLAIANGTSASSQAYICANVAVAGRVGEIGDPYSRLGYRVCRANWTLSSVGTDCSTNTAWIDASFRDNSVPIAGKAYAVRFNGYDNYLSAADFDAGMSLTVELWLKLDSPRMFQAIVGKHFADGRNMFILGIYGGGLQINVFDTTTTWLGIVLDTRLRHLAVQLVSVNNNTNTRVTVFDNAVLVHQDTLSVAMRSMSGGLPWSIGQEYDGSPRGPVPSDFLSGYVDEVRIWTEARTSGQIAASMNSLILPRAEPNLAFYFRLDEGQGTVATNLGSTGGTASLVGTADADRTNNIYTPSPFSIPGSNATLRVKEGSTTNLTLPITDTDDSHTGVTLTLGTTQGTLNYYANRSTVSVGDTVSAGSVITYTTTRGIGSRSDSLAYRVWDYRNASRNTAHLFIDIQREGPKIVAFQGYGTEGALYLDVTFSEDTNRPAVASKASLDAVVVFTPPLKYESYVGRWASARTLSVALLDSSLFVPALLPVFGAQTVAVRASGLLRDAAQTSWPSDATSGTLTGAWGTSGSSSVPTFVIPLVVCLGVLCIVVIIAGAVYIRRKSRDVSNVLMNRIDFNELTDMAVIASGGFGEVLKARFRGSDVAVKRLLTKPGDSASASKARSNGGTARSLSQGSGDESGTKMKSAFVMDTHNKMQSTMKRTAMRGENGRNSAREVGGSGGSNRRRMFGFMRTVGGWLQRSRPHDTHSEAEIAEFRQEMNIMCSLRHPNIVLYMGCCETPYHCIVQEFLHKGSVFDALAKGDPELTLQRRIGIAIDAMRGIQFLHGANVLHCDLKSPNLLLSSSYTCKIADFGLAVFRARKDKGMVGSVLWCPPEMLEGITYTTASDIYSFGVILWELITSEVPYAREMCEVDPEEQEEVLIQRVTKQDFRPIIPDHCPRAIARIIRLCWHFEATVRPSAGVVAEDLAAFAANHFK
eukprot:Opistho-2@5594